MFNQDPSSSFQVPITVSQLIEANMSAVCYPTFSYVYSDIPVYGLVFEQP